MQISSFRFLRVFSGKGSHHKYMCVHIYNMMLMKRHVFLYMSIR